MTLVKTPRGIRFRFYVKWNGSTWTDESEYVIRVRGDQRISPPGESMFASKGFSSEVTLTLANEGNRFSPTNTTSPIYTYIRDGKSYQTECYISISVDGGGTGTTVFTGTIKIPQETGKSINGVGLVEITARSAEDMHVQKSLTTPHQDFQDFYLQGKTEEELIAYVLEEVGLVDGTDFQSQAYTDANGGTATLDPGMFIIPWFWMDDESPIEECWKLASACGGRFYADPADKKFYYQNAQSYITNTRSSSIQHVIDWDLYDEATLLYNDKELYDEVVVTASPRTIEPIGVLWEPDEPLKIPGGQTITITANMSKPVFEYDSFSYTATTAGGLLFDSGISITPTYYAQRIDFIIANSNAYTLYLRNFQVLGRGITGGPSIEKKASSDDPFWSSRDGRTRSVSGNAFIQTSLQAEFLANLLLNRQEHALLTAKIKGLRGDPTIKAGDRVQIDSPEFDAAFTGIISQVTWAYSYGDYSMSLDIFADDQLYDYTSTPGYIVVGTDVFGGSKVLFV